jgi:hypothetical protein
MLITITSNVKGQEIKFPDLSYNSDGDDIGVSADEYNNKVTLFSYSKSTGSLNYFIRINQWNKVDTDNYSNSINTTINKVDTSLKLIEVKRVGSDFWLISKLKSNLNDNLYLKLYLIILDSSLVIKKEKLLIQLLHEPLFSKCIEFGNYNKLVTINCDTSISLSNYYTYPTFLTLDSNLNITSSSFLIDSIGTRVEDLLLRNDSSIFILATKFQSETFFAEINPSRNNLSTLKSYSDISDYRYSPLVGRGQYLGQYNNSMKVFSASDSFNNTTYSNVAITSLDSNFNITSKKTLLSPAQIPFTDYYSYVLPWYGVSNSNSDDKFIGASYIKSPSEKTLNTIIKLDSSFNFEWEYQFNKTDTFIRIIHTSNTSDGGCLVVANSYSLDNQNTDFNIIFFKLNKPVITNGVEGYSQQFNGLTMIYPNPFQNQIQVINNQKKIVRMKLINQSSQILIDKEINHSEPLDTQLIGSGIYYIQIQFSDGTSYIQKLVKQ